MGISNLLNLVQRPSRSLLDLSQDLHDARVTNVLSLFQERTVSRNRVIAVILTTLWCVFCFFIPVGEPETAAALKAQATDVIPELTTMLLLSTAWWVALRNQWIGQAWWVDAAGSVGNFVGVAIILPQAWNLACLAIAYLPMAAITIGARYTKPWFLISILASTLITYFSAPEHFWAARPYFALFTFFLVIGLPLSVNRLLQTLRVVTEAAIRARDAHSQFVATMSHELRTPLNSVVNATEMLESETDYTRREQLVDLLSNNAHVLRNRVNAVLDVRSIESGRVALLNEPFTFGGLIKTLSDVVSQAARDKHIEITMSAGSAGDVVLRSDPARVEQILTNLLSNAIKFTPAGGRIDLTVAATGVDAQGRVLIEAAVKDTGIGIPEAAKAHIFEPFYQVSVGPKRSAEGIGLGLHVVKSITQLMQGEITVEDNPGGGTVFRWVVPMQRAAASEKPNKILAFKEAIAAHRQRVRPQRVLVIDDNTSNREIANRMLQMAGHSMVAAETGEEGLRKMEQSKFDLVLLDLHMPGLSGIEVLTQLQTIKQTTGRTPPPIVVLSADATPQAMDEARQYGAIGYLMKPVAGTKLLHILEDVSGGNTPDESVDIVEVSQAATSVTKSKESFLDYLRAEGNQAAVEQFTRTCLTGIEGQVASLTIALAAEDLDQCAHHFHCLKNEFIQLGEEYGIALCTSLRDEMRRTGKAPDVSELIEFSQTVRHRLDPPRSAPIAMEGISRSAVV